MLLTADLYLLGLCAVFFILRIHKERRDHDRELLDQRTRMYQGSDLDEPA
jgi:hypothetical protein